MEGPVTPNNHTHAKHKHTRPSSIFEYVSSDMLVGGAGKGTTMHASVRRARLLHLIPLLALMILVIVKLMY